MALSIEEFLDRYSLGSPTFRDRMQMDLELIILNARTEGIWEANAAFDKGQRLVSLKRRK